MLLRHSPQLVRKGSEEAPDELFLRVTPEIRDGGLPHESISKLSSYEGEEHAVVSVHSSIQRVPRKEHHDVKLEQITSLSQLQRIKGVPDHEEAVSPKMQVIIKRNSPHLRIEDNSNSPKSGGFIKKIMTEQIGKRQLNTEISDLMACSDSQKSHKLFDLESQEGKSSITKGQSRLEDVDRNLMDEEI